MVDPGYKKIVNLSHDEAIKRRECVSEVEYNMKLALLKGNYYFGKGEVNFYLEKEFSNGEVFIEF